MGKIKGENNEGKKQDKIREESKKKVWVKRKIKLCRRERNVHNEMVFPVCEKDVDWPAQHLSGFSNMINATDYIQFSRQINMTLEMDIKLEASFISGVFAVSYHTCINVIPFYPFRRWLVSVIKLDTELLLLFPLSFVFPQTGTPGAHSLYFREKIKDNVANSSQRTIYTLTPLWASYGSGWMPKGKHDRLYLLCPHHIKEKKGESDSLSAHALTQQQEHASPNPHGKWKVAGLTAYWQAGVCAWPGSARMQ